MTDRPEDWKILGVEPGTEAVLVRRAYQERRALYESDTLATYNLLDDDEREEMMGRIDSAYERIVGDTPDPAPNPTPPPAPSTPQIEVPTGPAPDLSTEPGELLRYTRLKNGLTLHQIATETKIGVQVLEQIENEDFAGLPATVFVRGHVQQFARELKMDKPTDVAKHFIAKMEGLTDGEA
jgi:hypothetical protein